MWRMSLAWLVLLCTLISVLCDELESQAPSGRYPLNEAFFLK